MEGLTTLLGFLLIADHHALLTTSALLPSELPTRLPWETSPLARAYQLNLEL